MDTGEELWEVVFRQAVEFHSRGRLSEAASLFAAILEHHPGHFPSLHRLAAIRRHQDRLDESAELLKRAVAANPDSADIHNSLGNTWNALERQEDAVAGYRRALELRPHFPEAHLNLGNSFKAMKRYQEAAAAYHNAISLRPEYVEAHTNLGAVLEKLNRPEQALESFSAALSLDPSIRLGYSNVGKALSALNRHGEALPFFERARQAEPDAPEPVFNEAIVRLAMGDYEAGFRDYEARLQLPEFQSMRVFPGPAWNGRSPISGKTILLHAEQGLGDTILFARYIPEVVAKGARVLLEVQRPLVQLLSAIAGVDQVFTAADELPAYDEHISFGSLPLAFSTTLDTIPERAGYLKPVRTAAALPGPRVGVCWAGNLNYAADYKRSIPLDVFARLFQIPGVSFVSLQQNPRPGDDLILADFPEYRPDRGVWLEWVGGYRCSDDDP